MLIYREKPNKEDINAWHVDVPDGVDYVIFDTKTNRIIYTLSKYDDVVTFNMNQSLFAYIKTDDDNKSKFLIVEII